ncbi:MAG TPA: CdaR family protein [Bryobacteraceae bacterium]|nr:CdaR family protein [Bryobacteraceae bacterium]
MKQLLLHNLGWKALSLLIAIALWVVVAREPQLATSLSVPVEFKNMPNDLDFSTAVPDRVRLELRGQSGRLSRENLSDIAVVLDLTDAHMGDRTYTIRDRNLNLPAGVFFDRSVPSQLTLHFEHIVTRDITIRPVYQHLQPGYHVTSMALDPARVRIHGPEQRVTLMETIPTDPIDLNGVIAEKTFRTHVNLGDPLVRTEIPVTVAVTIQVARDNSASKAAH